VPVIGNNAAPACARLGRLTRVDPECRDYRIAKHG
jgi:hypothetical protein